MKKFENDLSALNRQIAEMSELAQRMVGLAAEAVQDRNKNVRDEVNAIEKQLDAMQVKIDQEAIRMLTVYGPVATDLRHILVVTHVTSQLERMGDQVINVFESLDLMQSNVDHPTLSELHQMVKLVQEMVDDALSAYFEKDAVKAEATRSHDDLVDALNAQVAKKLLSEEVLREVLRGEEDIADALAQILIARHLERIADQAVNISKEVVFWVSGADVRHSHKLTS